MNENFGADPFMTFGSQHQNANGKSNMGVDGFMNDGGMAQTPKKSSQSSKPIGHGAIKLPAPPPIDKPVAMYDAGSGWDKTLIAADYAGLVQYVNAMKTAINSKDAAAVKNAATNLKKYADALVKYSK